jgi:hypothetical protein
MLKYKLGEEINTLPEEARLFVGRVDADGKEMFVGDSYFFDSEAYWYDLTHGGLPLADGKARTRNEYDPNKHKLTTIGMSFGQWGTNFNGLDPHPLYCYLIK